MSEKGSPYPRGGARDASADIHKVLSDPLRRFILGYLIDHETCSAVEISRVVGRDLASVSYHLRYLRDRGFIKLTRQIQRRGATEFRYRLVTDGPLGITVLTRTMRRGTVGEQARAIGDTLRAARERAGLSEAWVAGTLLIPVNAITAIEAGTASPPLYKLLEFAGAVQLELHLIPTGEGPYQDPDAGT